jgi:hypothetical protein
MYGSSVDYDGDGNIEEGISYEISGLQETLLVELQARGLVYNANAYPYFFDEAGESFSAWTPRLLRAAYNFQFSQKDPGGFAHGGKYIIQLLFDSIDDLGADISGLSRDDQGHFQGSAEAFRHWDGEGEVPASCSRCHSAAGLPLLAEEGVAISQGISNGFQCSTCHERSELPARYLFATVTFPSGATVTTAEGDESGLCMQCHQGRESSVSVDRAIGSLGPDDTMEGQNFLNVHYFAAGATRYGSDAAGGYQYEEKEYIGLSSHVPGFSTCEGCHDVHELLVKTDQCFKCHVGTEDVHYIRMSTEDFDGDGNVSEGIYDEINTMTQVLYDAIVAYSLNTANTNEVSYRNAYPYWFVANDGEDLVWTPALLRAAYNYQYVLKDQGGFAHNGAYILQLLFDSIEAIGGDISGMTRP